MRRGWGLGAVLFASLLFFLFIGRHNLDDGDHVDVHDLLGTWRDEDGAELRIWLSEPDRGAQGLFGSAVGLGSESWEGQLQPLHVPHEIGARHELLRPVGLEVAVALRPHQPNALRARVADRVDDLLVADPFADPAARILRRVSDR